MVPTKTMKITRIIGKIAIINKDNMDQSESVQHIKMKFVTNYKNKLRVKDLTLSFNNFLHM